MGSHPLVRAQLASSAWRTCQNEEDINITLASHRKPATTDKVCEEGSATRSRVTRVAHLPRDNIQRCEKRNCERRAFHCCDSTRHLRRTRGQASTAPSQGLRHDSLDSQRASCFRGGVASQSPPSLPRRLTSSALPSPSDCVEEGALLSPLKFLPLYLNASESNSRQASLTHFSAEPSLFSSFAGNSRQAFCV